jgi:hypothetical protein
MSTQPGTSFWGAPRMPPQTVRVENRSDLDEAAARLQRGDLTEALILIERAIPALDGLHEAVLQLVRQSKND